MAHANISVTERQFRCPVCLDVLKDPVSIPCGHTYCMGCIGEYWDQAEFGFFCPQCREEFNPRPALRRNTVLAEVVERLRRSEVEEEPEPFLGASGEVPCDFCPAEGRLRAVRSCLVCLASFCELHGLPHRDVVTLRRHKLVPAVESLSERLCAQHRLGLEPAGPGASEGGLSGNCLLCEADREESTTGGGAEALRNRRQVQLQETQRSVQIQIRDAERELEEFQQNLESLKACACAVLEDSETVFTDMAQRLDRTKAEVRLRLEAKERSVVSRAERDLKLMEQDLEDLRTREQDISQLLQSHDPDTLLQLATPLLQPVARCGPSRHPELPTDVFSGARHALCHLRSRLEELCQEEEDNINKTVSENHGAAESVKGARNHSAPNCKPRQTFSASVDSGAPPVAFPLSSITLPAADQRLRMSFLRYWCRLTLDADTANPTLVLLEGHQGAHCGEELQPYPPHPQRFDSVAQVLCSQGQAGGASYWEVEWKGGGWVDIGVTYRGIGRKGGGKPCLLGRNENSWRLRCTHAGYAAWHDNRKTTVAAPPCPRIGVFLERHKGALSFYSVSDSVMLLHTFRCPFPHPLYPAFRLDLDSTLLLCPQEAPGP